MAKSIPTHLYHGTSSRWLKNILKVGLEPRGSHPARDNWKHVAHRSHRRCVYLTDSYAPYFSHNTCRNEDEAVIIEIRLDSLNQTNLYPDEDFLEQITRGRDELSGDMSSRTIAYRKRLFEFDRFTPTGNANYPLWWQLSLASLGTCSHKGVIPVQAISRIVTYPYSSNFQLTFVWNPTISLINQRICGDRYRELTRRLFAGEFTDPAQARELMLEERFVALPPIKGWKVIEINP